MNPWRCVFRNLKKDPPIPSGKLTWQWKMGPLKMYILSKNGIFHCYLSLLACNLMLPITGQTTMFDPEFRDHGCKSVDFFCNSPRAAKIMECLSMPPCKFIGKGNINKTLIPLGSNYPSYDWILTWILSH